MAPRALERRDPSGDSGRTLVSPLVRPLATSAPPPDTSTMSPSDDERRYSDREFALILRAAAEVGAGPTPASPREGLTLAEIRQIAAEVGIDPERVSRAAALLPSGRETALLRLIGGNPRQRMEQTVAGLVPPAGLSRMVEVARRVLDTQGETREVLGGVEWKAGTSTFDPSVSITPRSGETVVHVSTNGTEAMLAYLAGIGLPVGGVITVILGKFVFGETGGGIAAAALSGFTPAFLFARALWSRSAGRWRERLLHLMEALTREAEAAVENGGAESETGTETVEGGQRSMIAEHRSLEFTTRGNDHIIDLTSEVQALVAASGISTGQVALLAHGSTGALTTLEYEPGLVDHDIAAAMERLAPRDARYEHEETWHDDNGHSHVRASTVGPSLALPIAHGAIPLGTWQQIVFMDFDTRPRKRTVHLSLLGV